MFKNYEINVRWVTPPEEVASFFGISKGKQILQMDRPSRMEKGPIVFFTSYFHRELV